MVCDDESIDHRVFSAEEAVFAGLEAEEVFQIKRRGELVLECFLQREVVECEASDQS